MDEYSDGGNFHFQFSVYYFYFIWILSLLEENTRTSDGIDVEMVIEQIVEADVYEDESIDEADVGDDEMVFVKCIQKVGKVLLHKSQTPPYKTKKKEALTKMVGCLAGHGITTTENKVKKKIENMKTRLKKKIDLKKTGNLPIALKPWEKLYFDILDGIENPSISRLGCK